MEHKAELTAIAKLFLKLGIIGFGGPAAHIAMMQNEVVVKRKWLTDQHFLDMVGATNLIPGPNSTELALHIGYEKGGWKGLLIAGMCFILPAVIITGIFTWLYKEYGHLPKFQPYIYGIKPAIITIVLSAVFPLAKKSLKSSLLILLAVLVLILAIIGVNEIFLMFGSGIVALLWKYLNINKTHLKTLVPLPLLSISNQSIFSETNLNLFLIFLKIGAILYGSGYVLFGFIDAELVAKGLLSKQQLTDAIAVGQFTPGPVFSSVTFIGYQINGVWGALVSTIAIFLPSFIFVALLKPIVKALRNSNFFSTFLDAVNAASVAIIGAICFEMSKDAITDWRTILIAFLSMILLIWKKKMNSAFIVLGGSLLGYLLHHL